MNYKEKKELLESYLYLQRKITGLVYELLRWGCIGTKITSGYNDGLGCTSQASKTELGGSGLAEVRKEIEMYLNEAVREREKVIEAINHCQRLRHRELLTLKYVNGFSNGKIAEMLGKKEDGTIYKAVNNAINAMDI